MEDGIPPELFTSLCCRYCCLVFCGLGCFLIFFLVLADAKSKSEGCGIPVFTWLQVYFGLALLGSLIFAPALLCLKCSHPLKAIALFMFLYLVFLILIASWLIYGYTLYFSEENNCTDHYDTTVASVFMCLFMIFGLFLICIAVICCFAIPIIYCTVISPALDDMDNKKSELSNITGAIRKGLDQMQVDASMSATFADPCTICLEGFNDNKEAVRLNCGHVFHP